MKKFLKYSVLIAFTVMLHATMMEAMKVSETLYITSQSDSAYFISQEQALKLSIELFYNCYAELACEVAHLDFSHILTNKSNHRLIGAFREYKPINSLFFSATFRSLSHNPMDPVTYYVFGLRKIII